MVPEHLGGPVSQKTAKAAADRYFSLYIRAVGFCENCHRTPPEVQLQCAHWISRRYSNTRCDPENAFSLCAACHRWFTDHPTEFGRWAIEARGEDTYQRLLEASREPAKVDWEEQRKVLKTLVEKVWL
jgi:hypothetical protein